MSTKQLHWRRITSWDVCKSQTTIVFFLDLNKRLLGSLKLWRLTIYVSMKVFHLVRFFTWHKIISFYLQNIFLTKSSRLHIGIKNSRRPITRGIRPSARRFENKQQDDSRVIRRTEGILRQSLTTRGWSAGGCAPLWFLINNFHYGQVHFLVRAYGGTYKHARTRIAVVLFSILRNNERIKHR